MQFSNIIGQQAAKQHLLDSIHRGRLPHALMLRGPSGVGALQLAHAIAQYVNCQHPTDEDSCGQCASCRKISQAIHPDIHYVLPIISKTTSGKAILTDAYLEDFRKLYSAEPYFSFEQWQHALDGDNKQLMISVHEIRELKRKIFLKTFEAEYKIVILWQAELIRTGAANAFLKLLEEPPDKTLILLTCEDPGKLLITINSRCQQVALERIPKALLEAYLVEKKAVEVAKAKEIATISEGSLSHALTYMQESHHELNELYSSWLRMVYTGNYSKIQQIIEQIYKENKEFQKLFLAFAVKKLRDSLLFQLGVPEIALVTEAEKAFQQNFSKLIDADKVEQMVDLLDESRRFIAGNAHAQMAFTALSLRLHSILRS